MQTGEPTEDFYPPPHDGITYEKSPDEWEVNIATRATDTDPKIAKITIIIKDAKTPQDMLKKLKDNLDNLGWQKLDVNGGSIEYRRRLIPRPLLPHNLRIYLVGRNEQYLGTSIMDIKLTEQAAKDWVHEQPNDDPHVSYCYKEMPLNVNIFEWLYSLTVDPNMNKLSELWEKEFSVLKFITEPYDECMELMQKMAFFVHPKFYTVDKPIQYAFYIWALNQKLFKPFKAYLRCRKRSEACKTCEFTKQCEELNKP